MPELFISIDPGFDSMKVIANGKAFKFPFNVALTDERKLSDYALRDDFILYKGKLGTTYRVGQYAREYVFENKELIESEMDGFYDEHRFISESFSVGLDVAIALAIEKNGLFGQQRELSIHLIVALPHAYRNKFADTIAGHASGEHSFHLRCGRGEERHYQFSIERNRVKTVSQTIAAILGETSDAQGNMDDEKAYYLTQGPTLVMDGGYYTFGLVAVSRGGSVDDTKTESDVHHAMKNVNIRIAEEIQTVRPDVRHYVIEYLLSKDNGVIRYLKDGRAATLDLSALREQKMREVCVDLIDYLNRKYNNLLDFRYALVTGGTGACFYKQLLAYYKEAGIMDEEHLLLTSSTLNGIQYPIEFAIAVGAFKGLMGTLR